MEGAVPYLTAEATAGAGSDASNDILPDSKAYGH